MDFNMWPIMGNIMNLAAYGVFFLVGWLWKARKASLTEAALLKDAVRALIRDRLIHKYEKCMETGWCSVEYLTDIEALYETYTALGGNGIVPGLLTKIKALPSEPPDA